MSLKDRWRLQPIDSKLMVGCVTFSFLAGIIGQCGLTAIAFSFGFIGFTFGIGAFINFLHRTV